MNLSLLFHNKNLDKSVSAIKLCAFSVKLQDFNDLYVKLHNILAFKHGEQKG